MTHNEDTGPLSAQNNGGGQAGANGDGKQPPQYRRNEGDQPTQQFGPFVPPAGPQPQQGQQPQQPQQQNWQQGQPQWNQPQPQWNQQPGQFNPQGQYYPQGGPAYSNNTGSKKSGGWIVAVILIAIIVVLGLFGFFGYQALIKDGGNSDETQTAQGSSTGDAGKETTSSTTESTTAAPEEEGRPERPALPAGAIAANDAARNGDPAGDFNQVWRGTEITSEPFAQAVRDAFVRHYLDTDQTSGTVNAYSSVTGQTYTMKCTDNDEFVTCTGGNNAVVYIA
ncbi:MAG TPA: hypothetical protein H9867_01290 [Candidatus Corynebacterium gallistercoris]|uniref:Uncharacterized protein n=1 Tax=Candidatus Corynebacterium gallistercoris TaxID=2838530 RepID=A0A9D1UP78_9CORY|nr:hypothetical protein [Candidatus Corynebacterium gallistercoris]